MLFPSANSANHPETVHFFDMIQEVDLQLK